MKVTVSGCYALPRASKLQPKKRSRLRTQDSLLLRSSSQFRKSLSHSSCIAVFLHLKIRGARSSFGSSEESEYEHPSHW